MSSIASLSPKYRFSGDFFFFNFPLEWAAIYVPVFVLERLSLENLELYLSMLE